MTQYSLAGYLSALEMRSSRTLLVEGISDSQIINRILNGFIEAGALPSDSVVIDTADLIDRTGLYIGVREFLEYIHSNATAGVEQFFVIVDREFRGFDLGPPPVDKISGHYQAAPNCMWTRGHSIENYMFSSEQIIDYLRHHYPESVPVSAYSIVAQTFHTAIVWCGALTLSLLESRLIGRADGLCTMEQWDCGATCFLVRNYASSLAHRCDPSFDPEIFSARVEYWHSELSMTTHDLARWLSHGHISNALLWVVVGKTLAHLGVDSGAVEQIALGMKLNKMRTAATWWMKQIEAKVDDAPTPLIDWLIGRAPEPRLTHTDA